MQGFTNSSLAAKELSKSPLSKIIQSGGFLGRLLGPFMKVGLPLMKNVQTLSTTSVLVPLGLTPATSALNAGNHEKILGYRMTTLIA